MYSFAFNERSRVLTIRVSGFWTQSLQAAFLQDAIADGGKLMLRGRRFGVLVDCRDFPVQTGSLAQSFGGLIVRATRLGYPIALLFAAMLIKKQAERALGATGAAIFLDEAAAREWLAQSLDAPAPARGF